MSSDYVIKVEGEYINLYSVPVFKFESNAIYDGFWLCYSNYHEELNKIKMHNKYFIREGTVEFNKIQKFLGYT
jgi:hypothetical protein